MSLAEEAPDCNAMAKRILVADDSEVIRRQVRTILEPDPDLEICAEVATGLEAVREVQRCRPDLAVLDFLMPEMNGFEAAAKIAENCPDVPVIMFSLHLSEDVMGRFKTGAIRGAVAKSEAARDLLNAVRSVLGGGTFFPARSSEPAPS